MLLRLGSLLWVILSIIIVGIPLGIGLYFLGKRMIKSSKFMMQKVNEVKALDNMRKELLEKRVQENESEKIWDDFDKKTKKANVNDVVVENSDSIEENKLSSSVNSEDVGMDAEGKDDTENEVENLDKSDVDEVKTVRNIELEAKQKKLLEKINHEALALKKEGKLDMYEKKLIEGLAIDPQNKDLNQLLADLYFTMGNHNKALSLLKKIIELDPQNHNAIWQLGEIYLITGDFETAELLVEKAIGMSPANPKYYISLVEIYYNTERKKDSINIMEKVVRLRPTNANYIYTLANLYEEIEDLDSAKKYYFRVLECEPSNEKAKKKLKSLS